MYYFMVTVLVKVLQIVQMKEVCYALKGISQLANDYFSTLNFLLVVVVVLNDGKVKDKQSRV